MSPSRRVAILGGVRIPFVRNNTAYHDVGNLGMSIKALGAVVEKFKLHGEALGEVAMGAVLKHSSDWNIGREATLSSGLSPATPVLLFSGYAGDVGGEVLRAAGVLAVLPKPVDPVSSAVWSLPAASSSAPVLGSDLSAMGDGYHLHPDRGRIALPLRRGRLVQPGRPGLGTVEYARCALLRRGGATGDRRVRAT